MLILYIIQKITNMTQEELANFIGVSRVTLITWLHDNNVRMSYTSKKMICDKFNFPMEYFDYSLNESPEVYKIIYTTIKDSWSRINPNVDDQTKINNILNNLDILLMNPESKKEDINISDEEIIDGLCNGYNPFTGEILDKNDLLSNVRVKRIINKLASTYKNQKNDFMSYDDLNIEERILYDRLKKWRLQKNYDEELNGAFKVFSNKELINIVCSNIDKKEDLLKVRGIGDYKYEKYGDELFELIKESKIEGEK